MQSKSQKKVKELLKLEQSQRTVSNYKDYTMETKALYEWKLPDGRYHREFGPAVIYPDGSIKYYFYGIFLLSDQKQLDQCINARDQALSEDRQIFNIPDSSGNVVEIDLDKIIPVEIKNEKK